jgi:rod shape-determining protein MreC
MRGLYQLFAAYGNFLLFLFLEGLSILLLLQFNHRQSEIFNHSWMLLTAGTERQVDELGDYVNLRNEVFKLQGENQALKQALENAKFANTVKQDSLPRDSTLQPYAFVAANVISNSITTTTNYLRIDRGSADSVATSMGVISSDGIVGVVRAVTPNYSSVMSLLHRQTRVKAAVGNDGYFGTLRWNGLSPQKMLLEAVPKHATVEPGDTVYTSGYSQLFPPGIIIGTVEEVNLAPGQNFYSISIKLRNDLSRVRYVYVVRNRMREEHKQLEEQINE